MIDDLVWYKYHCTQCGHDYESTGKTSICPTCRSRDVKEVSGGSGKKHGKRSPPKPAKKQK
jgi:Zn finger protein HypA/HybF involved in hydrogenase expression